ncbi:MAG: vWA domain-containing protein [Candidatus Margulisiibacteriota bacterium]
MKKLLLAIAVCLFLLASLISASQISTQRSCQFESDCGIWEACLNHNCIAKEGFCKYDYECESGRCDSELHICKKVVPGGARLDVLIILDASGSMYEGNKLLEAKKAAINAVDSFEDGTHFALTYVGASGSCQISEVSEFIEDKGQIKYKISKIEGRSNTALGYSLRRAYGVMGERIKNGSAEMQYVIVFTDGIETCGENPCEIVKEWHKSNRTVPTYTIAHMITSAYDEQQLRCITNITGGEYYEAPTNDSIREVFAEAVEDIKRKQENDTSKACFSFCKEGVRYYNGTYNEKFKACGYCEEICEFGCENARCILLKPRCDATTCTITCIANTNMTQKNCTYLCIYANCTIPTIPGTTECAQDLDCVDNCWLYAGRIVDFNMLMNNPLAGVGNGISNIGKTIGCPVVGTGKHVINDFKGGVETARHGANLTVWAATHPWESGTAAATKVYNVAEHEISWCMSDSFECSKKYRYKLYLEGTSLLTSAIEDVIYEETGGAIIRGDWGRPLATGLEMWGTEKIVEKASKELASVGDLLEKTKLPVPKLSPGDQNVIKTVVTRSDDIFIITTKVVGGLNETAN